MELPGLFVMSITPFDAQDRVDERLLRIQLRRFAAEGIGVYLGSPGTGEGHALELPELRRMYEIGVEEMRGKAPVFASGRQPRAAKQAIALAREAEAAGVGAWQLYPPDLGHGHKPTGGIGAGAGGELEAYYDEVLSAVKLPALLSTHHGVGYGIPVALLVRLCGRYPQIIGVNLTNPRIEYVVRANNALTGKVKVFVGSSVHMLDNLALGGYGCVDWAPNVAPKLCASITRLWRSGETAKAAAAWARVMRLNTALNTDANGNPSMETPRGTKAAMRLLGQPAGEFRQPFQPVDDAAMQRIAAALKDLGIRESEGLA